MRNMSFIHTKQQVYDGTKTETTRKGWDFLKESKYSDEIVPGVFIMKNGGYKVMACEQCQGLKKGEKIKRIRPIRIVKVEQITVSLQDYDKQNVINEGFPNLVPTGFIRRILMEKCKLSYFQPVNRITFEYIENGL